VSGVGGGRNKQYSQFIFFVKTIRNACFFYVIMVKYIEGRNLSIEEWEA